MHARSSVKTILILAANPTDTARLRLDQEEREIDDSLILARKRDYFDLKKRSAVKERDIRRALLRNEPQIVHFCGHGYGLDGLAVETDDGKTHLFPTEALAELFKLFKNQVECVVLNACFSEVQARAISQHIPYVVGMSQDIGDRTAVEFAVGFYDALGAGRTYREAYQFGCNAIATHKVSEALIPKLYAQQEPVDPLPFRSKPPQTQSASPQPYRNNQGSNQPSSGFRPPRSPARISLPTQRNAKSLSFKIFIQKAWWLMALVLAAWLMTGLEAADAEDQLQSPIFRFLSYGALAGAVSGICGGWTLRRLNSATPLHQVLLGLIIGSLAGALLWLMIAELYMTLIPGGLRSGSGGLGLSVGVAIIGCIYGVARRSQAKG
ncbi:MAG: CHAT domain-containing protein [Timaviella obliquedivisa GSE-PSE-MK23-08B]|jgi:hypothetical protein|nr:CHAT domain-containing protein [Timaviella obliquedivisa GSE-PSE-MK23-08B]